MLRFHFADIVILRVLYENSTEENPARQEDLVSKDNDGLINDWIRAHGVTKDYSGPVRGTRIVSEAAKTFRQLGFLGENRYIPTEEGRKFIESLGDDWRRWPLVVETDGETFEYKYREDFG